MTERSTKAVRLPEVKREIVRLFTKVDIDGINEAHTDLIQRVVGSLISPPALSRDTPLPADYHRVYALLRSAPEKKEITSEPTPDMPIGMAEISLVMQALVTMTAEEPIGQDGQRQKMLSILRAMSNGQTGPWLKLRDSMETGDIRMYAFLRESLLRARQNDASQMQQAPVKRSRKRFWDGGVSV